MAQVLQFPREYFVWVDETGSDARTHIRRFGYSLLGIPPVYTRTLARGKRISAIAAISSEGLCSVELTYNSVDSDKFFDFIRGTLIPTMQPFDGSNTKSIVIMDDCSIHHFEPVMSHFLITWPDELPALITLTVYLSFSTCFSSLSWFKTL